MDLKDAIRCLDKAVNNAKTGLPDELFYFVTRLTPMVNVDLLVKDSRNRTLLAWRKDTSSGAGWHVPGGIVRYKEKLEDRIKQVSIQTYNPLYHTLFLLFFSQQVNILL